MGSGQQQQRSGPPNGRGLGDGSSQADIQQPTSNSFCLRAERSGKADARSYTLQLGVTDRSGNRTVTNVIVSVPHSNSPGCRPATDEVCEVISGGLSSTKALGDSSEHHQF